MLKYFLRNPQSGDDSFSRRKKLVDVWNFLERLVNETTPNLAPSAGDSRSQIRHNRAIPTLVAPLSDGSYAADKAYFAITKDVSDVGISLIVPSPLSTPQMVCGFWLEGLHFLLGELQQNTSLGGGFWQAGVRFTEVIRTADVKQLLPLASQLQPASDATRPPND